MKKLLCVLTAAIILLTACSKQDIPTWQEQYDLGVRYLSEGNYEEAIIAFTAAIEIDPKQAPAYVGRADAYIGLGESEENLAAALADYEQAIEIDKTYTEAYLGLAHVYICMGDYDLAQEILQHGLEMTSGNLEIEAALDEIRPKVESVSFERILSNTETARIRGLDSGGNTVWSYETEEYERTELWRTVEIGLWNQYYFFVEAGAVTALNADTGEVLWQNSDFLVSPSDSASYIDDDGTIYLCGYYGPDFYAVDLEGNTLCRIESIDPNYYWADSIQKVNDTTLAVEMSGGPDGYRDQGDGHLLYIDINSFTSYSNEPAQENDELVLEDEPTSLPLPSDTDTGIGQFTIGICQLVEHELLDAAVQGFEDALTAMMGTSVQFDYRNAEGDASRCSVITDNFVAEGVDLILAASTHALQAAASSTTSIPILGTGVTDYALALNISNWTGTTGRNISGTSDRDILQETSDYYELGYTTGMMAYEILINDADVSSMAIRYS